MGEIWLVFCESAHFPSTVYSTPNLKMFPLHGIPEILYAESIDTKLIICEKSFPLYDPVLIHNTSVTNRQTDGWTRVGMLNSFFFKFEFRPLKFGLMNFVYVFVEKLKQFAFDVCTVGRDEGHSCLLYTSPSPRD